MEQTPDTELEYLAWLSPVTNPNATSFEGFYKELLPKPTWTPPPDLIVIPYYELVEIIPVSTVRVRVKAPEEVI